MENIENKFSREQYVKDILDDIKMVGSSKPIGYLPLETITGYCKVNIDNLIAECHQKGLQTRIFTEKKWPGYTGSLWVYDLKALQKLLDENRDILISANWPTEADAFISNLYIDVPIGTPLYKLIAKAFNDTFSENLEADPYPST